MICWLWSAWWSCCTGPHLPWIRLFHSLLAQPWRQAICLPSRLFKGLSVASENGGNFHFSYEPAMHCSLSKRHWTCRYPLFIFKQMMKPDIGHVPYHTGSLAANRVGLCNSLACDPSWRKYQKRYDCKKIVTGINYLHTEYFWQIMIYTLHSVSLLWPH